MVEAAEFFQRFHLTPLGGLQQRPRLHVLASFPLASPDKRTRAAKVAARRDFCQKKPPRGVPSPTGA